MQTRTIYLVGFASDCKRGITYPTNVPEDSVYRGSDSVDLIRAVYDGEVMRVKGFTDRMVMRGVGMKWIPCIAWYESYSDAETAAFKLSELVESKTRNNAYLWERDWTCVGPETFKDTFRGLWSRELPNNDPNVDFVL